MPLSPLLTTRQAAQWLQLSPRKVGALADAGIIPCIRLGKFVRRFKEEKLAEWAEKQLSKSKR